MRKFNSVQKLILQRHCHYFFPRKCFSAGKKKKFFQFKGNTSQKIAFGAQVAYLRHAGLFQKGNQVESLLLLSSC